MPLDGSAGQGDENTGIGAESNLSILEGLPFELPTENLVEVLDRAAETYGDHTCFDFMERTFTYKEFSELVEKAAAGLQAQGVEPGQTVGIHATNSPHYPIMFFAILKAGATVANISPLNNLEELREQILDNEMDTLVTLNMTTRVDAGKDVDAMLALNQQLLAPEGAPPTDERPLRNLIVCPVEDMMLSPKRAFLKATQYPGLNFLSRFSVVPRLSGVPKNISGIMTFDQLLNSGNGFTPVEIGLDNPALVQYTSGSTSKAKGALLSHFNLAANAKQILDIFAYKEGETPDPDLPLIIPGQSVVMAAIPYFHVFAMMSAMLTALKAGTKIVIVPDPRQYGHIIDTIKRTEATHFPVAPTILRKMMDLINEQPDRYSYKDLISLQVVVTGGEAFPEAWRKEFVEGIREAGGDVQVLGGYGSSETSPTTGRKKVRKKSQLANEKIDGKASPSIGEPVPGTTAKVVKAGEESGSEDFGKPVPRGEEGELWIKGPQVMKEYRNRPEETEEVLVIDQNGDTWYRTGDIVKIGEDGELYFIDRNSRGYKIGAEFIHPGLAENALLGMSDGVDNERIAECNIFDVLNPKTNKRSGFARIRLNNPDDTLSIDEILKHLEDSGIRGAAIPKYFQITTNPLPTQATQKIDWKNIKKSAQLNINDNSEAFHAHNKKKFVPLDLVSDQIRLERPKVDNVPAVEGQAPPAL